MSDTPDLFPDIPGGTYRRSAYPWAPGTGPENETCGTCLHCYPAGSHNRSYFKCDRIVATHGEGTDIVKKSPACIGWDGMSTDDQTLLE